MLYQLETLFHQTVVMCEELERRGQEGDAGNSMARAQDDEN
jgi:hypothetical protein